MFSKCHDKINWEIIGSLVQTFLWHFVWNQHVSEPVENVLQTPLSKTLKTIEHRHIWNMQWKSAENILKTVAKILGFKTFERLVNNVSMTVPKTFPTKTHKKVSKLKTCNLLGSQLRQLFVVGMLDAHRTIVEVIICFLINFYPSLICSNFPARLPVASSNVVPPGGQTTTTWVCIISAAPAFPTGARMLMPTTSPGQSHRSLKVKLRSWPQTAFLRRWVNMY